MPFKNIKVGIFHPTLNLCGGAEWVAINIINSLRNEGYQTVVLTNEKIDHEKIKKLFGKRILCDSNIVFPLEFFNSTDLHNVYTDCLRALLLKSKCDVLIDTQSNALLTGANLTYIHFPFFGRLNGIGLGMFKRSYYFPYRLYERQRARSLKQYIFSNSNFTANAVKKFVGTCSFVLYPPASELLYASPNETQDREDIVVSIARISPFKRLTIIPRIARLTDNKIQFIIIGLKESQQTYNQILESIKDNKVSDRVKILTDVPRESLLSLLRKSKIFLHPAISEHFGVVVAEAMASGCIPIVHDSGGPRELVPDFCRFNEEAEAAKKIENAISHWSPNDAKNMMNRAREFTEDCFSKRFLTVFEKYLELHLNNGRTRYVSKQT